LLITINKRKIQTNLVKKNVILYRTAKLHANIGSEEVLNYTLKIIGKFHPAHYRNTPLLNMPALEHTSNLAKKIAQKLQIEDLDAAIKEM